MTALPLLLALFSGATVNLTAERLLHDDARKVTTAEGDAELTAEGAAMHADRITWDEGAQAATASGNVTLRLVRRGLMAIVADVVTVRMNGDEISEVYLYDGLAMRKKGLTAAQLLAARTPDEVRAAGSTTMTMNANHLVREGDDEWVVDDLGFTPCECNFDRPSWRIGTSRTTLNLESERASLLFPVIYVRDVPVLWFPWLSLPLSDRQTGLLVPKPNFTSLNGFSLEQPVFVTLGRSADLTFTPGYFFGGGGVYGIEGPRLATEFRYAPSVTTTGRASFGLIYDRRLERNPLNAAVLIDPAKRRGVRAEGTWQHVQELGKGWHDRVNASFLSDGYLQRDFTPDVLAREAGYLRSTATLFHRGVDHFAGLDVVMRQDLSTGYSLFANQGPNPVQRLPGLTVLLPSRQIAGPLSFSVKGEAVRLAPTVPRLGSLEARERFDLMPRLDIGGVVGGALGLSAFAAWRQDVWLNETTGAATQRGYPLLGARVEAELARTFAQSVRHTVAPSVELRAVPLVVGAAPASPYDEIDCGIGGPDVVDGAGMLSTPRRVDCTRAGPALQAVAQVRQRLLLKQNGAISELLTLDLGQGVHLLKPRLGETFARLTAGYGLFHASTTVRVDPVAKRLTRASVLGALEDRGRGLYLGYENLLDEGSDRSQQPLDLLVGPPLLTANASRTQALVFGAHWRTGGVGLRYDTIFLDPEKEKFPTQQTVGISYGPACECWRFEAFGTYRGTAFPDFGATLTISGFGTLGTGG